MAARRAWLRVLGLAALFSAGGRGARAQSEAPASNGAAACAGAAGHRRDVDSLWSAIAHEYVYLPEKAVDWPRARALHLAEADTVSSRGAEVQVLERLMDELYDAHASLRSNTRSSYRLVPSGLDLWAEWRGDSAVVTAVRPGFGAEQAGVRPGMHVVAIDGVPVALAARERLGGALLHPVTAARQWALLSALAGRHDRPRRLTLLTREGATLTVEPDAPGRTTPDAAPALPPVEQRWLEPGIGYIRLNALGDVASVPAFDSALAALRAAHGLVLDLRNTPGGGNTGVAEPILGRFLARAHNYQRVVPRHGRAYVRRVSPRGPWTYTGAVVVLVGRWTGSMGEGMAIGLDGMGRATIVGTRMAGLAGSVDEVTLPCSGIRAAFATARLLHLDGTPRERFRPPVLVDLAAAESARPPTDLVLARALAQLGRRQRAADAPGKP